MEHTLIDRLIPAIVTWIVEHGSYATKTKLLKLLYLFDVEYYRVHRVTFTGFSWKFFHLGPWAAEYDPALGGLLAHGILSEQHSNSSEYDTAFYKPVEPVEARRLFAHVKDECILLEVLNRWGTRKTGEILNYVYFQTEPMEAGIRNQPLDFSLIPQSAPLCIRARPRASRRQTFASSVRSLKGNRQRRK